MTSIKSRYIRYTLMTLILGIVIYLALGFGSRSFEDYCPFGGAESLWGLIKAGEFSCALGPLNLSLMLAMLALVLIVKKSFCGWACPIGFLSELLGRLGGVTWKKRPRINRKIDSALKFIRYPVLIFALYFTYKTGELVLRGYDPFYLIFSGFGHGSAGLISILVTGVIVVGVFVIPMAFCRYLCPMGAIFDPFSRLGLVKITRDNSSCTSCGKCSQACIHDIPVHQHQVIRHKDCTNCLECMDSCKEKDVLKLRAIL